MSIILEKGYRPTDKLNTNKPPAGGSAVPSIPPVYKTHLNQAPLNNSQTNKSKR
jgi:hypothetical protein